MFLTNSYGSESDNCVLYAIVLEQYQNDRQFEAGVVRCNGTAIDGSCDDVRFVETWRGPGRVAGVNFLCYPHGSFTNGTEYRFKFLRRDSVSSSIFDSYVGGTQEIPNTTSRMASSEMWAKSSRAQVGVHGDPTCGCVTLVAFRPTSDDVRVVPETVSANTCPATLPTMSGKPGCAGSRRYDAVTDAPVRRRRRRR